MTAAFPLRPSLSAVTETILAEAADARNGAGAPAIEGTTHGSHGSGEPPEDPPDEAAPRGRLIELDDFLALDVPDYDWLVPDLIERRDRIILTSKEGGGKSTLIRQVAVQCASGIHPFGGEPFPPLRVFLLDLENSAQQVSRKIRPLRLAAGDAYAGALLLHVRAQGLDLLDEDDAAWLRGTVADARPDLFMTGPIYKLAGGDPTEERTAKAVAAQLDHLRVTHNCALMLEAHTPYATNGGKRPERPYGASLWSRWPEFGIYLDSESGQVRHWRGARDERDWPSVLQRGGAWPWTPVEQSRDVVWARITEECFRVGGRPSIRDLATRLGIARSSVHRAVKDHEAEWEAMA